jgi:tryptophanyl-tRNA synthetase
MRILSGLQPTGRLHIGNYFGMMQPALQLQHEGEAFYFIADYHTLTAIHHAAALRENVRDLAIDFLACGLDPEKSVFFRQSDVPEHTELAWILSNITPMPMLENAHSYKDKVAHGMVPNTGLFTYPVLMAADILIYDSDKVPVGKDQKQHLEITRDIAAKMNATFGEGTVKVPTPLIREETAIVPGLDGQKMSKSYGNSVGLFEEEKALKKLIMRVLPRQVVAAVAGVPAQQAAGEPQGCHPEERSDEGSLKGFLAPLGMTRITAAAAVRVPTRLSAPPSAQVPPAPERAWARASS